MSEVEKLDSSVNNGEPDSNEGIDGPGDDAVSDELVNHDLATSAGTPVEGWTPI